MTFFSSEKKQKFPGAVKSKDGMFFCSNSSWKQDGPRSINNKNKQVNLEFLLNCIQDPQACCVLLYLFIQTPNMLCGLCSDNIH